MAIRTVNPDGTITGEVDTLDNRLNLTNSSMVMPELKDAIYGAFGDVITLDDASDTTGTDADTDFKYGVYQLATQKPPLEEGELQKIYGTGAMPIFEWVKTIQTGERTYDPNDFEDRRKLEEYKKLGNPDGFMTPEQIQEQTIADTATGVVSTIGQGVGKSLAEGGDITSGIKSAFGFGDLASDFLKPVRASELSKTARSALDTKDLIYNEGLATRDVAEAFENTDLFNKAKASRVNIAGKGEDPIYAYKGDGDVIKGLDKAETDNMKGGFQNYTDSTVPKKSTYFERVKADATSKSTVYSSAGAGIGTFFTDLLLTKGKDPAKSAKKGAGAAVGTYVGAVLGGPIGSVVGATVGASIGGRVICNELRRHGLMTTEDILIDYYFTQNYLTPTHVNGYHIWAVSIVRSMRKGKSVKLWHHIAHRRLNEVKYVLGKRDKPDYLGKVYRLIGESTCFILGKFCKKTDWSVLYNRKEI